MKARVRIARANIELLLGAALLSVWGCMASTERQGVANTRGDETMAVVMPADAPSIWRGFHSSNPDPQKEPPSDHFGLDILGPVGMPVIAPARGVVTASYFEPMYGNHVDIDHGEDEEGRRVSTRYLHLKSRLVKTGEQVRRGQALGGLGRTGLLSGGMAHLHYELYRAGPSGRPEPVDPHLYWIGGAGRVTCFDRTEALPDTPLRMTYPVVCGEH